MIIYMDTSFNYNGITLNEQDIDLMMIATAANITELQNALNQITNITNVEIPNDKSFDEIKQDVYNQYIRSLTSKNVYLEYKNIELIKKINYISRNLDKINNNLADNEKIGSEKLEEFNNILKSYNINEILIYMNSNFNQNQNHQIFKTMHDYSPIEKSGVINTSINTYQRMFDEMKKNYNSITIDALAKYGNVALYDGTFDFSHLKKALDFAQKNNKQVRLNALIFYMDFPKELNIELEKKDEYGNKVYDDEEKKQIVKDKLTNYVNEITLFIKNNNYENTVRSIDVFNELLNRFAMDNDEHYKYRGDIDQNQNIKNFDNIDAGWLKYLDINDLCDVIKVARNNLKNTVFMYNDDNVVDLKKLNATNELLDKIQKYEKDNNTSLVNSIGIQMHISNDVEKQDIIEMFRELWNKYKLPIEITEFDLAMTNVDGLSEEEINIERMKKIKEFFDAINECKNNYKIDIRGFTIWSKTDEQNFRVSLENEIRLNNGQEPIKTLHGGFYNNDMTEKTTNYNINITENKTKEKFQDFNYHTHTYRSGHSEYVTDEEILKAAKEAGISKLGFTEHIPNTDLELPDEDHKMLLSEVDEYISSINKMKQENPNMTILSGFEAEYDPMKIEFLREMKEKVDYLILGQHFVNNGMNLIPQEGNPNYPMEYANMVCKGIRSGLFDIVAHPDCFMELRDKIDDKDKVIFKNNCIIASNMICKAAEEMGIPIEINLGNALKEDRKKFKDGNLGIPHPLFWEIAKDYNVKVLKGIDAHSLQSFKDLEKGQELITNIEKMVSNKMVEKDYNPVKAREKNQKLQDAYNSHHGLSYETNMIKQILNGASKNANISEKLDTEKLVQSTETSLTGMLYKSSSNLITKKMKLQNEINKTEKSEKLSKNEKSAILKRKREAKKESYRIYRNQLNAIKRVKNLKPNNMENKNISQNIDKQKVLKKTNNQSNYASPSGFANIIFLSLIAIFIAVMIISIGYIINIKNIIG